MDSLTLTPKAGPPLQHLHSSCPICGGTSLNPLWRVHGYSIVRCAGCALAFVQNILTREELASHYVQGGDPVYSEVNRECLGYYYTKLRGLIEARYARPGRLLDVGCSGGWFLDAMQGWECHGCDIAPPEAGPGQRHGDRFFEGDFDAYPGRDGFFDVITMQDVFDHMPQPLAALAKCHRMLKSGGLLVVKVHNISCLYAKLSGPRFYAVIPPTHLFYYDRNTLSSALSRSGFRVVESRFIAHQLQISTVFMRLSRDNERSAFRHLYKATVGRPLGNIRIRKNLHDVITVLAVKRDSQSWAPSPSSPSWQAAL